MTDRQIFDLSTEPVPVRAGRAEPRTTVIEASAGTGKTYAVVGLVAKYLAAGIDVNSIALITFTRPATRELRQRLRGRIAELVAALAPDSPGSSDGGGDAVVAQTRRGDPVARALLQGSAAEVAQRRENLATSLTRFDEVLVGTTHSFCQQMLTELGILGDAESHITVIEDSAEFADEVARDEYLRRYGAHADAPHEFSLVQNVVRDVMRNRDARIIATRPRAAPLADIATAARQEVAARKRRAQVRDYDDLQHLLLQILHDPVVGEQAIRRIRERFSLVMVDEFQDTDPVQWGIVRELFHQHAALFLVGDPKQAIYGFRGASVRCYQQAKADAARVAVLPTNFRSDPGVVAGVAAIFGGAALGSPDIVVDPVLAHRDADTLVGRKPVRLYAAPPAHEWRPIAAIRAEIAAGVATDIGELLERYGWNKDGVATRFTGHDIAVLVRNRRQAEMVNEALREKGIAATFAGSGSVFATTAARDWLWVLGALIRPDRASDIRRAALTNLIGKTTAELDSEGAEGVSRIAGDLRDWAARCERHGFAAMFADIAATTDLEHRVLAQPQGERTLTDLRHVAQLCHAAATRDRLNLTAVAAWLDAQVREPDHGGDSEQSRRLDSDRDVVQILTMHSSKGLEFPVVYVPFGWDVIRQPEWDKWKAPQGVSTVVVPAAPDFPTADAAVSHTAVSHTAASDAAGAAGSVAASSTGSIVEYGPVYREIDTAGRQSERVAEADREAAAEELRLLYVAATRAQRHLVLHWASSRETPASPLQRLLFGRSGGTDLAEQVPLPDDQARDRFQAWYQALVPSQRSAVSCELTVGVSTRPYQPQPPEVTPADLAVARFAGIADPLWRRTSFSALAHGASAHEVLPLAPLADDPDTTTDDQTSAISTGEVSVDGRFVTDEPEVASSAAASSHPTDGSTLSLMNDFAGGTDFGNVVHYALEIIDPQRSADLAAAARAGAAQSAAYWGQRLDTDRLGSALEAVLATPLGTVGGTDIGTLAAYGTGNRLSELDFEFPLAGGLDAGSVSGRSAATLQKIADLLRQALPATDPLSSYAEQLATVPAAALRGYLKGSIDAVLRLPQGSYLVVDYKTNRPFAGELSAQDYSTAAMAEMMIASHYPLQALLYAVALHRFLRWRLPDYHPQQHLAGAQYHFVRGMIGPDTPAGCGVMSWDPGADLIVELSDLLAGLGDSRTGAS